MFALRILTTRPHLSLLGSVLAGVVEEGHVEGLGHHGVVDVPVQTRLLHRGEVVELQ